MDGQRVVVTWEVADDESFTKIVQQGRATAAPELGYSVHVERRRPRGRPVVLLSVHGRRRHEPDRPISHDARPRTPTPPLRLAVASCQHYEQGLFTAYQHMAREEIDLVAHLGDYIYEYGADPRSRAQPQRLRDPHPRRLSPSLRTVQVGSRSSGCACPLPLDRHVGRSRSRQQLRGLDRRERHGVRGADASSPGERLPGVVGEPARSRAARDVLGRSEHHAHGGLGRPRATLGDGLPAVPQRSAVRRRQPRGAVRRLGRCVAHDARHAQERWLTDGLASSAARWSVLANQVMVAPYDNLAGDQQRVSMDQWSGYPAARARLLESMARSAPNRTVVLTGDIHSNWVNELRTDFRRAERPSIAAEFVGTSISSGGDGSDDTVLVDSGGPRRQPARQVAAEPARLHEMHGRRRRLDDGVSHGGVRLEARRTRRDADPMATHAREGRDRTSVGSKACPPSSRTAMED